MQSAALELITVFLCRAKGKWRSLFDENGKNPEKSDGMYGRSEQEKNWQEPVRQPQNGQQVQQKSEHEQHFLFRGKVFNPCSANLMGVKSTAAVATLIALAA